MKIEAELQTNNAATTHPMSMSIYSFSTRAAKEWIATAKEVELV